MTDRIIRVFPRRTKATPIDAMAFVGDPPLFRPEADKVMVSCTFTWDKPEAERLAREWGAYYPTEIGGPAYNDPGGEFTPGLFLKPGYVITSRGCPNACGFCFVPKREGKLRELPITEGFDVLDNNLLACSDRHMEAVFAMLGQQKHRARFSGGLEAARVTPKVVSLLQSVKVENLWLAFDRVGAQNAVETAVGHLRRAGLTRQQISCYVLVGYQDDTMERAERRLRWVFEIGAMPFSMLFRADGMPEPSKKWRQFHRLWCRPPAIKAMCKGETG
ncbi:MAG: hypothetical protein WC683_04420 [bacterium]